MFLERLIKLVNEKKTALVVGLDPDIERLPHFLVTNDKTFSTRTALVQCVEEYVRRVIDLVKEEVAVVKFQSACYECLGGEGMLALERLLHYAEKVGLLVVLDGKRGDVPSTARFYAEAYLGRDSAHSNIPLNNSSAFPCDALTVQPYLGIDSLTPFFEAAVKHQKGIFVCVKTSNPGSGDFQDLKIKDSSEGDNDSRPLYEHVAMSLSRYLKESVEKSTPALKTNTNSPWLHEGYSPVGIVVGATYPEQGKRLREVLPEACFLIPGWGHQGANSRDFTDFLGKAVGKHFKGVLFNVSRGVLTPTPAPTFWQEQTSTEEKWEQMIRGQIREYKSSLAKLLD